MSPPKRYYGTVYYVVKNDDGRDLARVDWFSDGCYFTQWWDVKTLVRVCSFLDYQEQVVRDDYSGLEAELSRFEADNPMPATAPAGEAGAK